jgi:hypothetical protein
MGRLQCLPAAAEEPIVIAPISPPTEEKKREYALVDKQVQGVWSAFRERLAQGDAKGAADQISEASRPRYMQVFLDLGDQIRELPTGWSELRLIDTYGAYAEYLLSQTFEGQERLHIVVFVRDPNGRWFIESL